MNKKEQGVTKINSRWFIIDLRDLSKEQFHYENEIQKQSQ